MNTLKIENFKAFEAGKAFEMSLDNNNMLVYGENGIGKTSIFEAIKLFYFRGRILSERIRANVVEEQRDEETKRVIDDYKHNMTEAISLSIDEVNYCLHNVGSEKVFMISYDNLDNSDDLKILDLVNNAYYTTADKNHPWLFKDLVDWIVEQTNKDLNEDFMCGDVHLNKMDNEGRCSLSSDSQNVPKYSNLNNYFNESILHIVKFIILIECITLFRNDNQKALLVLDDCFNSLDQTNRTFMMKFLLKRTKGMQKIVFTHNIGFFNLFRYIANNIVNTDKPWLYYQLCKISGSLELIKSDEKTTADIKKEAGDKHLTDTEVGNELRRRFEVIVYQLANINNVGELQESRSLLDRLCSPNKQVYLSMDVLANHKCKDIYNLIDEIYANVTNGVYDHLALRLKNKIEDFRKNDFLKRIRPILVELRLMQKVALHQTSHGHAGLPPVSSKEIEFAYSLLDKLEKALNSVSHREDISSL